MPTVLRQAGFRIVIYLDDHEPAHVHAIADGETKVMLNGSDGLPQVGRTTASPRECRRALLVVREHAAYLRKRWDEIHG